MGYYTKNGGLIGVGNIYTATGVHDLIASSHQLVSLYAFSSFTFDTSGLTGRTGPTLTELLNEYDTATYPWLNDTNYFNVDSNAQGVQMWTVPTNGTYRITCAGASGGYSYDTTRVDRVGQGAIVRGDLVLAKGTVLRIVVGQKGRPVSTSNPDGPLTGQAYNSGGGGGSFVFYTLTDTEPLIVAGGGGGGSYSGTAGYAPHAATDITGNPGTGVTDDGATEFSGLLSGQSLGDGGPNGTSNGHKAGGGAGWKANGGGGHTICTAQADFHVQGGWFKGKTLDTTSTTSNGGPFMGGWGGNDQAGNGSQQGGFGGGGGGTGRCGSCQSGGGGGYTGGGLGSSTNSSPTKEALAGGGNYVNVAASNRTYVGQHTAGSDGYVTIQKL